MKTSLLLATAAFLVAGVTPSGAIELPEDIADMKVQELRAGGDEKKRYFLIQRSTAAPKDGWRTLFVLPGGSGDAQFQPFVTRIAKHALPDGYLVVQLVAPVWTPEQAKNFVWPNAKPRVADAKFTTAEFFAATRAEIAKTHQLDPRYSFTLTWSSSGMSGYEISMLPKSGVTGTFVAMSVFHQGALPAISAAKGHSYFLYHSPQDFIPLAHPERARAALEKEGATVELQTYEGGHGWHGDAFGNIREGIEFLEQEAGKKK